MKNEDDVKKQASIYFEDEDYNNAYKLYSQLVSLYPKDPEYNYRLGVCMLFTEPDKKKPFSYLQIALKNPNDAPKDAKFYLAKTYHVNYKFDEAIKLYLEYKQIGSSSSVKKLQVDREIAACRNGKQLLSNLSDLVIISKKQLNEADYFRTYDIKDIGGKLLVKPDDFKSAYDKKKKDKSVVYLPRNGERVYFSSYGDGGANGKDIFFVNRLPNGSWSKPQPMPSSINTEYDEDYPFLHPNGKTLYFSSKGHNSMGGYDVFKTTYDSETLTWSKPENLEFPINSPDDDILFVTDSLEKTAFFSTGRYSPYGKIDVLKINTERRPMNFAVVKGTVVKEDVAQSLLAKITVKNIETGEIVGTYQAKENGDYAMELPNGGKFIFTVETPGLTTQSDGVQIPIAYSLKPYKQVISYEKKVLKIINYFDGQIADDNYSMMIDLIEKKAKLEVNENDPYNKNLNSTPKNPTAGGTDKPSMNSVPTNNPTTQDNNSATKSNTNQNVTNEQLLSIAKTDAIEAETNSKKLKQEAQDAFGLATQKTEEALSLQKEADEAIANANTITDVSKKNEELAKANKLKEEATIATNVANIATEMAKKLEVDANSEQKEADLTNQYISQLEAITKNKNNKEALTKLEAIQKQLDDISKEKNQSDELFSSIKAEVELKQNELKKSESKSNEISNEIKMIQGETTTLETDLANENDKSLKENIAAQIRELKSDVDLKNKELAINEQKITNLKNQLTGLNKELAIASKILNEDPGSVAIEYNDTNSSKSNSTDITDTNSNENTNQSSTALSLDGLNSKYDTQLKATGIDKNNKESLTQQNEILKNYNQEISDLIALDKNELSKTTDATEKKELTKEIKELEKRKTANDKSIVGNAATLKKLDTSAIAVNTSTTTENATTIDSKSENTADGTNTVTPLSSNNTGTESNSTEIKNTATENDPGSKAISSTTTSDNSPYLNELNNLKNAAGMNSEAAKELFAYNDYKENGSSTLKQAATQKFESANTSETNLSKLIATTETNIKNSSANNPDGLLNEAETLNTKAFELRTLSASKTGTEKEALLKQAVDNENLAVSKKLKASEMQQAQNKNKFESNNTSLKELQKLTGSKTTNEISQANMLADEAIINFNQAQKIREESNAYPSGAAKLGGLSNAEEKENEALLKQQKAIELLAKANPSYNVKPNGNENDPANAIAQVSNALNKTMQAQQDAYVALSKANQNELKLLNTKLLQNTAFKTGKAPEAQELKKESDQLNTEAKTLLNQAAAATNASEKATLLLKANEKEISALKKLNEASDKLKNAGSALVTNTPANNTSTNTPENNSNTSGTQDAGTTNSISNSTNTSNQDNATASKTETNSTKSENQNSVTDVTTNSTANSNTSNQDNATTSNVETNPTNSGNQKTATNTSATNSNATNQDNSTANNTEVNSTNSGNQGKRTATNSENTTNGNGAYNTTTSTTSTPQTNTITPANTTGNGGFDQSAIAKLKADLNTNGESNLTSFNAYSNTEAISLKEKATEKINAALNEDKAIAASLDNVSQLMTSNSSQALTQETVNADIVAADKMNEEAYELRKTAATKTSEEKEKDLSQAKQLEDKAISKKVETAAKQQKLNAATFEANAKSLEELAVMAKGKNIAELGTADMQMTEASMFFNQAQQLREETNSYPTDAAKLGGLSNSEEKEAIALSKQTNLLATYKKYFSNYVPVKPNTTVNDPAATAKYSETKSSINTNNQAHIDGLLLLSKAVETEYKSRLAALPAALKGNQLTLKTKAQELYKKYQTSLTQANQAKDPVKKKALLVEANKNGQEAINQLSQIAVATDGLVTNTTNTPANNNTSNSNRSTQGNTNAGNVSGSTNATPANTGNNARNPSNGNNQNTSTTPVVKLKVEGLEVKNSNAYNSSNPIPLDEKIPDGLVFKVQIGAFKSPLPNNTFKGLSPVIAQTTPSGYIRYMAGNFEKYESANAVKNDLKNLGYSDAFVVVYFNGKRINLNEGVAKAREGGQTVDLTTPANTSAGITANSNIPRNTFTTTPVNASSPAGNDQVVEIANELEKMNGLLYTVQIGVYSKQVTRSQLNNLRPIYTEKLPSGLYRYTAGIYNQSARLLEDKRKVVDLGVKDAFVSAYYNAKRIPFAEGQKLQAENNNLKMETQNPIIFSGTVSSQTTPNNVTLPNNATPAATVATQVTPPNTNPSVTAFNNGVTTGPAPTAENGVKTDEAGISYKVQIGAYKNQVPNDVAAKFMNIKTWPVNNATINGLFIYTIGNFNSASFAKKLKEEAISLGITDAFVTVYKDGKKLYGAEATEYLNK